MSEATTEGRFCIDLPDSDAATALTEIDLTGGGNPNAASVTAVVAADSENLTGVDLDSDVGAIDLNGKSGVLMDAANAHARVITKNGGKAILTKSNHQTGTDRIYEVFKKNLNSEPDLIINLQGIKTD